MNKRVKNGSVITKMDSDTFINPYLKYWGLKIPLIFIEQSLIIHPEIDQCFVHISEESNIHPSVFIIIQENTSDKIGTIYECSNKLKKEIKNIIKHEISDIIIIDDVIN